MQKNQLDGLIALKSVADHRSFTAAADALGVSPPAISQTIKQLEERLGVALLSRTTRKTNLTEAGQQFLSEAGPALDQILNAMNNVGTYALKPSGLLRINLPKFIYPSMMAPIVKSFMKKYPEVSVELFFQDDLGDLVESGFDAGIRLSELTAKDMVAMKIIGPIRFVIAGSPKYFNRMGRPKRPQDLLTHRCLVSRFGDGELYDRWEFEHKGKDIQVQVKGSLIVNDSILIVEHACEGMGLTYCVDDLIQKEIQSGKLELVLEPYAPMSDGFYLYYPKRSQVMPKLRAFIDHIREIKLGEIAKSVPIR